ncbi:uncharacterized protein TNIN_87671 [Trichonephila inaurata madagascariensis]|uniref:Uncharacterized protein n=1 Tax=Trichonephila inaurata madagascariensis TaxID=2747483 RepID=A0A8X6YII1_9ARAC|nr:uncharacterized protein TNIN_87671 [Trichonephila inaurata madagascariensis]
METPRPHYPKLCNLYTKFIEEYLSLDRMEEITNIDDITSEEGFFLPHHGVLREGNHSFPLRVVFNGSQKTDLDICLNDVLCKGGVIQDDLFSVMLRVPEGMPIFSAVTLVICFGKYRFIPIRDIFKNFFGKMV